MSVFIFMGHDCFEVLFSGPEVSSGEKEAER